MASIKITSLEQIENLSNINQNKLVKLNNNFHNTTHNHNTRKNDSIVDYKYICIKKDYFDVNMINLNYNNIKKNNHIEIIYKSPYITLEGLYFKTPLIHGNLITIYHKDNNYNTVTIKLLINQKEHSQFIQILRSIDENISGYINKYSLEIETILGDNTLSMLRYEQIIKYNYYHSNVVVNNTENKNDTYQIYLKSYLDKDIIFALEKKLNKKYSFTFNISNIYLSNNNLLPLIKCNRCEVE